MDTSNHTGKGTSRVYWLTRPGQRLAAYLDYVEMHPPVAADIQFGDVRPPAAPAVPPEQFDDDRQQPRDHRQEQLDRLYNELDDAMEDLRRPNLSDSAFEEYRLRVQEIRRAIHEIEGE